MINTFLNSLKAKLGPTWKIIPQKGLVFYNGKSLLSELGGAAGALARSQYKFELAKQLAISNNMLNKYGSLISTDTKFDINNELHVGLLIELSVIRDAVKFQSQQVSRTIDPRVMEQVDARQTELYGSITTNPYVDLEEFHERTMKMIQQKFAGKEITLKQIFQKALMPGGADIVPANINLFADAVVQAAKEVDSSLDTIELPAEMQGAVGEFVEKPDIGVKECFIPDSDKKWDVKTQFADVFGSKLSSDIIIRESTRHEHEIDPIIKDNVNAVFDDTVKVIDDITPKNLEGINSDAVTKSKESILGLIQNIIMSTAKIHDASDPAIVSAVDKTLGIIQPYISAAAGKASYDATTSFTQGHSGELQKKLVVLSEHMQNTQQELDAKQAELKAFTANPDPSLSPEEIQRRKDQLEQEIQVKTEELKDAQDQHDTLEPSTEEQAKREEEYKKVEEETWERKEYYAKQQELLSSEFSVAFTSTADNNETKKALDGNFVSQVEQYLLNSMHGNIEDTLSNNVDVSYKSYTVNGSKVEVLLVEELFDCTTIIASDNTVLLGNIVDSLHFNTGE